MVATFAGLVLLFSANKQAQAAVVDDAPPSDDEEAPDTLPSATRTPETKVPAATKTQTLLQRVKAAAASGDWELASALALAEYFQTGNEDAVRLVSELRRKAGLEYTSILTALKKATTSAPVLAKPKKPAAETKAAPTKVQKEKKAPAATKVQKEKTAPKTTATKKKTKGAPVAKPAPVDPAIEQRRLLAQLVAEEIRTAKKGTEDRDLVKEYQAAAGLVVDGLYGPATAKAAWEDGADIPPNPYYWPANPDQAKASYRTLLRQRAAADAADAPAINQLIAEL
jgi:peptidoglycan hydrolase-like protein with peptidoglycan-binding domain